MGSGNRVADGERVAVAEWIEGLQDRICSGLESEDTRARFSDEAIDRGDRGRSRPRVLAGGEAIEKAAVNFSDTRGGKLPESALVRRPELAGLDYRATSISLIVHPRNPYAPTCHANFRFFSAGEGEGGAASAWWFGGGFDLTPFYGFEEDAIHWHATARRALYPHGEHLYPRFKQACDDYFRLPHRDEARGIGGIFFDDFDEGGFDAAFALLRSAGDAFLEAYRPILARRKATPYAERERDFQLLRRGRYVEFNLLYDRGTRFGLQAGAPTESILASMPPLARWEYAFRPELGSPEASLVAEFLTPRDWLAAEEGEV